MERGRSDARQTVRPAAHKIRYRPFAAPAPGYEKNTVPPVDQKRRHAAPGNHHPHFFSLLYQFSSAFRHRREYPSVSCFFLHSLNHVFLQQRCCCFFFERIRSQDLLLQRFHRILRNVARQMIHRNFSHQTLEKIQIFHQSLPDPSGSW